MPGAYAELRRLAYEANRELPASGLVKYAFGNASAMDRARSLFAIKPSGVPYSALRPADMTVVDLDGRVVDGRLSPSSDTRTHAVLYRSFPSVGGIVHTHSTCATAWAQAGRSIPVLGTTHADHLDRDVPCTRPMSPKAILGDYERETGNAIVKAFRSISPEEVPMVLVSGHGPFTWGSTAQEAVYHAVILEELSKMAFLTLGINPRTPRLNRALVDRHFSRKHGKNATYGQKP
jgi:L-ribulose-5-phosphate 4-epimerase